MAATKNNPAEKFANLVVTHTRVFNAPRELVWKVWTDPKHIAQWWGPEGFTNPRCDWDACANGAIHIDMRGPDGTVYPMTGTFKDIKPPERLIFLSSALNEKNVPLFDVMTTVVLSEKNNKTTLTLQARVVRASAGSDQYLQGMEQGWGQSLDRLAAYVAKVRN